MSKRLILFSNPTESIFEKLNTVLFPQYLSQPVFAYMPSDGSDTEGNLEYTPIWQDFAKNNNAEFIFIDNSTRGGEAEIEKQKLLSANILMITGGNTFTLLNHLRLSGLDQSIIKFWHQDNIVLSGFSAGAVVLGPTINTANAAGGDINQIGLSDLTSLSIMDFDIWPHYEVNQKAELFKYQTNSKYIVQTITNEGMIVIDK